jgi:5-methylthioadenosine/S-adenosylhomocysteine deaminase
MSVLFTRVFVYDADAPNGMNGPTDVLVDGQRIAAIGGDAARRATPDARIMDGHGRSLLIPGLINAHFHSPANHLKGSIRSLPLELFMLYESPSDPDLTPSPREAYLRTMLAAIEMLKTGTTSVQDDAFLMPHPDPEIIDAVASAYRDSGIRASIALDQPELTEAEKLPFIADFASADLLDQLHAPAPASSERLLELYAYLIDQWHGAAAGRITAAVSISAPQRVSPEYFAQLNELSRVHGLPLYAHMLETRTQRVLAQAQPRFEGRSLVDYTARLGLLNDRTNVIHSVWVDEHDLDLIAESGAIIAHNPISNLRLGSGVMPLRAALDRGITVALGSDEAICDDSVNMWSVAKMAGLIHNVSGLDNDRWPRSTEVLDALWRGGAAAQLKTGQLGAVREGHLADLAMVNLHSLAFTPLNDVREQLVYCESGTDVELVMVDGAVVVENGKLATIDETALLDEARETFARKRGAVERATAEADRWYPEYQRMVRQAAATEIGMNRTVGGL